MCQTFCESFQFMCLVLLYTLQRRGNVGLHEESGGHVSVSLKSRAYSMVVK